MKERLLRKQYSEAEASKKRKRIPRKWHDITVVDKALLALLDEIGRPGVMLNDYQLRRLHLGLRNAVRKYGGPLVFAERLGLDASRIRQIKKSRVPQKTRGFWTESTLYSEIEKFIFTFGIPGVLPSRQELRRAGRYDLACAIHRAGGSRAVAKRMGFKLKHDFKDERADFDQAILDHNIACNMVGIMPTVEHLRSCGKASLAAGCKKYRRKEVAQRLRLGLQDRRKPNGYWKENLGKEIFEFIQLYGTSGSLPGTGQFRIRGRHDITNAIRKTGGRARVAELLNLKLPEEMVREKERAAAAASLQLLTKLVETLRPLADTGKLSSAQIALILGRSGFLEDSELDEQCLKLRDSLLLCRTPMIDNGWKEYNDGVSGSVLSPFGKNCAHSAEQAAIGALSSLACFDIPLDASLAKITCNLLWTSFSRRLSNITKQYKRDSLSISREDLSRLIFDEYRTLIDNIFFRRAIDFFLNEVESAIAFVKRLHRTGWAGPDLRLDQADAAAKLAAVADHNGPLRQILDADEAGSGKTVTSLAAVAVSQVRRVLVIAPKMVADHTWPDEINKCLPNAKIIRGIRPAEHEPDGTLSIQIIHYDQLCDNAAIDYLVSCRFDCVIVDEAHFLKRRKRRLATMRRSQVAKLLRGAPAVIGLTGTPLKNEILEPLSILTILAGDVDAFRQKRKFQDHKLRHIVEVYELILPQLIRRRKEDLIPDLPAAEIEVTRIDANQKITEKCLDLVIRWSQKYVPDVLWQLRMANLQAKLPWLLDQVQSTNEKILILTYYREGISKAIADYLATRVSGVEHIAGKTPSAERKRVIDGFRSGRNDIRILVGTIGTIGTGLTLFGDHESKNSRIIVADLPYTWAEFCQGIGRLHRTGQTNPVHVSIPLVGWPQGIVVPARSYESLDECLWGLIKNKKKLSDIAIDGEFELSGAKVRRVLSNWLENFSEQLLATEKAV